MGKKLTKDEFVKKAVEVHGQRYYYSKVEYVNNKSKVKIICPVHGEFEQRPNDHLSGKGCPQCGISQRDEAKRSNSEEFIKKAREIHGEKYDYSKVEYINSRMWIKIICPVHGAFEQTPNHHLSGCGCPQCAVSQNADAQRSNLDEFIKKARGIYGEKYDYSKVEYVNRNTKVKIICHVHGEFEQAPYNHLSGYGCHKCGGSAKSNSEEFIKKAREIHGEKYDYSKVEYINSRMGVKIICPVHGEFEQTPSNHLSGCGCPQCSDPTSGDWQLYVLSSAIGSMNLIKVGIAKKGTCQKRCSAVLRSMREAYLKPYLTLVAVFNFSDSSYSNVRGIEAEYHKTHSDSAAQLEQFDGYTEFFTDTVEGAISFITQHGGKRVR